MKKLYFFLVLFLFTLSVNAQANKRQKIEKVGELYEVTYYYENGNILQHGFLSKEKKLHASWESFNENGTRKCVGFYDNGIKVGPWLFWNNNLRTKVTYKNNKIISVEKLDSIAK